MRIGRTTWLMAVAVLLCARAARADGTMPVYAVGDKGGASSISPNTLTMAKGDAFTSAMVERFTRVGYDLVHTNWYALWSAPAAGATVGTGTQVYTNNATCQAFWKALSVVTTPKRYPVALDFDGGADGTASVTATYDAPMPEPIDLPSRDGYSFTGYHANKNGSGTKYYDAAGASATTWTHDSSNVTVYAAWTGNVYRVTLDNGEDASPVSNAIDVRFDASPAAVSLPTCAGYDFGGYYTGANGESGVQYFTSAGEPTRKWNIAANTTLHARWTPIDCTVRYKPNGGEGVDRTGKCQYGSDFTTLGAAAFTRTGYSIASWNTAADGSGKTYAIATSYQMTSASGITLYAQWGPISYRVSFDGNGGDGAMSDQDFDYGVAQALSLNAFTRAGFVFAGWKQTREGEVAFADGQVVSNLTATANGVVPLYAGWSARPYELRFDAGSAEATGEMAALASAWGEVAVLPACAFARDGYLFSGWATNGTEVAYAAGATVSNLTATADHFTFTAVWTGAVWSVTYDASPYGVLPHGGATTSFWVQTGGAWPVPPTPADPEDGRHTFVAWTNGVGQSAASFGPLTPPPSAGAADFGAQWDRVAGSLAVALDIPEYEVEGSPEWTNQTSVVYGGVSVENPSAAAVWTDENTSEGKVMSFTVTGAGELRFFWKFTGHDWAGLAAEDWREFLESQHYFMPRLSLFATVAGQSTNLSITGSSDWRECSISFAESGEHEVEFALEKHALDAQDALDAFGGLIPTGTGYVDRVVWTPAPTGPEAPLGPSGTSPWSVTDGEITATVANTAAGWWYALYSATDLDTPAADWTLVKDMTNCPSASGTQVQFGPIVPISGEPVRFYRIRVTADEPR